MFSHFFYFENRAVYEIIWGKKNIVQPNGPQMTIWRMRTAWAQTYTQNM